MLILKCTAQFPLVIDLFFYKISIFFGVFFFFSANSVVRIFQCFNSCVGVSGFGRYAEALIQREYCNFVLSLAVWVTSLFAMNPLPSPC